MILRPLGLHLFTHLPGEHDIWLFLWDFWWLKKALFELHVSPYETNWVFHPVGVSLLYQALTPLNGLLAILLARLGGSIFAYDVLFIASFALSGYAVFLTARRITDNGGASVAASAIAGCIYAFSPFHFSHLHHLEHLSIQWTAFFFLALLRFTELRSRPRALLVGITFALVFYANVYLGLFSLLLGIAWFIHDMTIARGEGTVAGSLRSWLIVTLVAGILTGPVAVAMAALASDPGLFKVPLEIKTAQSLDLLAFITPSFRNPLLNAWHPLMPLYDLFSAGEPIGYLGLSVIALAVIGAWGHTDPRRRVLVALSSLFLVLSLGPVLHIAGRSVFAGIVIPLPQALLQSLPAIGAARVPARYLSVAMLFIALLGGMGWQVLWSSGRRFIALAAVMVLVVEYATGSIQLTLPRAPAYCFEIARDTQDVAVMDLPLRISNDPTEWWKSMDPARDLGWLQTIHGKRTLTGSISHTALNRRNFLFFLESIPLKPLVSEEGDSLSWPSPENARSEIERLKIRYFVLHKPVYDRMAPGDFERDRDYLEKHLGFRRIHDDSEAYVCSTL